MKTTRAVVAVAVALLAAWTLEAQPEPVAGQVDSVTLYRGQALVRRTVPVTGPAGPMEVIVAELPAQVAGQSVFAEGGEGVEVRSVRYRTRAVGEEPREEIRRLEKQIDDVLLKVTRNTRMQQLVAEQLQYIGKLETFVAPTATVELSKGVLDAKQLKELTEFSFQQRTELAQRELQLQQEAIELQRELTLLRRQHSELGAGSRRTVREAVVFIDKRGGADSTLALSYLVNGAGWSPAYNMRGERDAGRATVEYNAIVQQTSGEDWTNVELTLSTASPALSAEAPALAPFTVALGAPMADPFGPGAAMKGAELDQAMRHAQHRLNVAQVAQQAAPGARESLDRNWEMNVAAAEYQTLELLAPADELRRQRLEAGLIFEEPSVSYRLPAPVSLASRADQQMIRIASLPLPAEFYHVATPVLASYVYREAEIRNVSDEVFLNGPVSVYLDGRFVGRGELPTVASGQTFVMGFGADSQLRTERELMERKESIQGGNRQIKSDYRLTISNYKNEPVAIRLRDRIPISDDDTTIRVALGDMSDPLSGEALYLRLERPKGILRWDIEVPAGAAGETARLVTYTYTIEYDRQRTLVVPGTVKDGKEGQIEFEQMHRGRILR